jgi:iron complex transport system substrate-binding protein
VAKRQLAALIFALALNGSATRPAAVTAVAPAARIVSTSPSITETLFALGLGDRVIAVSQYSRFPPAVNALPKIGTPLKPDVERIVTLRPDLVIVGDRTGNLPDRLRALHVRFVAVPIRTLSDVGAAMLRIGEAAGVASHASTVAAAMSRRLEEIRRRPAANPRPRVLMIVGRNPEAIAGIVAVGRDGYLNDLMAIAGGVNVLDEAGVTPYPRISLETLLRLDPDIIIETIDMSEPEADRSRRAVASRALWQHFRTIRAVRTGRVYPAGTDALLVPGPRVVNAAEWLADLIGRRAPRS